MKIACLLLGNSNINYLADNFINYCNSLNLSGYQITAIFNISSDCLEKIVRLPISIKPIKQSFITDFFLQNKIMQLIEETKPDLIILFNQESYILTKKINIPKIYFLGERNSELIYAKAVIYNDLALYERQKHKIILKNKKNYNYLFDLAQDHFDNSSLMHNINNDSLTISICSNSRYLKDVILALRAVANIYYKFDKLLPIKFYIYTDRNAATKLKKLAYILNIQEIVIFKKLQTVIIKADIHLFGRYSCNDSNLFSNISSNNSIALSINAGIIATYIKYSTQGVIYKYNDLERLYNILLKLLIYPKYRNKFKTNIITITNEFNNKLANLIDNIALE
jgi:hypothetical protein